MVHKSYTARCFCGGVEIELAGEPLFSCYCHCESCRTWLGAPVHAVTLWQPDDVKITRGEELLGTYRKKPRSHRKHCTRCGGSVMNAHPDDGYIDVMASLIQDFTFAPLMHVHYAERVMSIHDGLPKYRDLPLIYQGSDILVEE